MRNPEAVVVRVFFVDRDGRKHCDSEICQNIDEAVALCKAIIPAEGVEAVMAAGRIVTLVGDTLVVE